jgi:hypothetical protein
MIRYELWLEYEAHICFARTMGRPYPTFNEYIAKRQ